VAATVERLEAHGGKRRSAIHGALPGPVYCYCEDPDGNVIEVIAPGA
jgi:catechol 2,3-dioxygenase-like lactoylglutathione lyase family enzyme